MAYQRNSAPFAILQELERYPDTAFGKYDFGGLPFKEPALNRGFHRLVQSGDVQVVQSEEEDNGGARLVVTRIQYKGGVSIADDQDESRNGDFNPPDEDLDLLNAFDYAVLQYPDSLEPCPTCNGTGEVPVRLGKAQLAKRMGFTSWYSLMVGQNIQIKASHMIQTKEAFDLDNFDEAFDLIVEMRRRDGG